MIEPEHPTEKYIEGRIAFHESGAEYYISHDQKELAAWSKEQAEKWRAKRSAEIMTQPGASNPHGNAAGQGVTPRRARGAEAREPGEGE